jgi:UPF0755 protein
MLASKLFHSLRHARTTWAVVAVLFFGGAFSYALGSPLPQSSAAQEFFVVLPGEGLKDVARSLHAKNLIRSTAAFQVYAFITGSAHRLKAGRYAVSPGASAPKILRELVEGPGDTEVLIIEGMTLRDVDAELARLGFIAEGNLVKLSVADFQEEFPFTNNAPSLEGFLFPDTYRIRPGLSAHDIVEVLLRNFSKKALPTLSQKSPRTLYENLIIASLIEREIPHAKDRPLVAGILIKRLALGMPLQIDATVLYAKCNFRFTECGLLTKNDLDIESVFNTYLAKGLPPSPISNPGLGAIEAALKPRTSDFLFYLSDPKTGKTVFSETFEEHKANKARYLHP